LNNEYLKFSKEYCDFQIEENAIYYKQKVDVALEGGEISDNSSVWSSEDEIKENMRAFFDKSKNN